MAVTPTAVLAGTDFKTWDVVASADSDTAGTITHGFGAAPANVTIRPVLATAYTCRWCIASVSATEIILSKISVTSSGSTAAQIRVQASRPHTVGA